MVKKSITKKVIDIEESDSSSDDNEVFENLKNKRNDKVYKTRERN